MHQILKELREDHDLTQKEVADMIGTNQAYYSTYESGEHVLSIEATIILADRYRVPLDYITGRKYERFHNDEMKQVFVDTCTYKELCESIASFSKPTKRALLEYIDLLKMKEEQGG